MLSLSVLRALARRMGWPRRWPPALSWAPVTALAAVLWPQAAAGQAASSERPLPAASAPRPWMATAPVPPVQHTSVLGRGAAAPVVPTPWAQANATVGRIGGWRAYAQEAQAPAAASAPAAPRPTPPGATPPHVHGHGG